MQNVSYENEFDLPENEPLGGTHFHMNGFTQRLVLTQRQNDYLTNLKVEFKMTSETPFEAIN